MDQNQTAENSGQRRDRHFTEETGINFKCPQCAGSLKYDIDRRGLLCGQCGSLFQVDKIKDPTAPKQKDRIVEMTTVEYHCPSCGASLHTTSSGITGYCSFCGSDVILEERMTRMRRPDRIVPFTLTREKCEQIYRNRLQGALLIPEGMNTEETVSHFRPVYIPFWCLSGEGEGTCAGEYSTVTLNPTTIRTDTYEGELKTKVSVCGIYYDACSQFDDETAQWLEFSGKKSVPFHPAYLSGLYAEAPDVESGSFAGLARDYAVQGLSQAIRDSHKTGVSVMLPDNFREQAELVLMPVWLLGSRQGGKMVYTAIKGTADDRAIRCELPVSPKRFIVLLCMLAVVFTALILRLHHFILLRPQITAALSCILAVLCWNTAGPFLARVHRQGKDRDPTRSMLSGQSVPHRRDILQYIPTPEQEGMNNTRYSLRMKPLLICAAAIAGYLLLYVMTNRNLLRAINSLISDGSILPSFLDLSSAVLLGIILARNGDISEKNRMIMIVQIVICVLVSFMGGFKPFVYSMSLISFVITLLVLLNAFRQHNEYVTRPVPFFDEKEGNP